MAGHGPRVSTRRWWAAGCEGQAALSRGVPGRSEERSRARQGEERPGPP